MVACAGVNAPSHACSTDALDSIPGLVKHNFLRILPGVRTAVFSGQSTRINGYLQSEIGFKNSKTSGLRSVLCKIGLYSPLNLYAVLYKSKIGSQEWPLLSLLTGNG